MKVVMYGAEGCPQCDVLANKLSAENVNYEKVIDANAIKRMGFMSAPILQVTMTYAEAFKWVMSRKEGI